MTMPTMNRSWNVCRDVLKERVRQDEKWGPQNHADGTNHERFINTANNYRSICDRRFAEGTGSWLDILLEEVWEAASEDDPAKLREELIQVAAVAVAWVEAIDRREP